MGFGGNRITYRVEGVDPIMEDPTDLTDELENFVHKTNQISKSRLMGICVIPGLAIEKTGDVYLRMMISYRKTDEDHGVRKDLWEDSDFNCWNRENNDSANDDLWRLMGESRSCCFTLILEDPDH